MKKFFIVLAVCMVSLLSFNANAQVVKNYRGLSNSMGKPIYDPVMAVGFPPYVTTEESNSFQCTPSAYRLCIDVNGTMDTITLPNSYTYSAVWMQQYIDSKRINHLYTRLENAKEIDTDVYNNYLVLFTDWFDGYIQIVDTANTSTSTSYDTYASQTEWKTGSSTYVDSNGRPGWIEIDTHTAKVLGSFYATCTWTSVVFDRGSYSNYDRIYNLGITITDSQSTGMETISYEYRTDTSSTNITSKYWTTFSSGLSLDGDTRYVQVRAILTTGNTNTSNPGVDTITITSYAYVLTGDKLFYKMGLDTEKHYGTPPQLEPIENTISETFHIGTGANVIAYTEDVILKNIFVQATNAIDSATVTFSDSTGNLFSIMVKAGYPYTVPGFHSFSDTMGVDAASGTRVNWQRER